MRLIPEFKRLTVEDVEHAAAVVRYVADHTPSIEEFERLADLLECCAHIYDEERRLFRRAKSKRSGRRS